jgi:hypothetical protein
VRGSLISSAPPLLEQLSELGQFPECFGPRTYARTLLAAFAVRVVSDVVNLIAALVEAEAGRIDNHVDLRCQQFCQQRRSG